MGQEVVAAVSIFSTALVWLDRIFIPPQVFRAVWQKWAISRPHSWTKAGRDDIFLQSMKTQNGNFTKDYELPRLAQFTRGYEICHLNFSST